jgi:hypothetical protein
MRHLITTSTTLRLDWFFENGRLKSAWHVIEVPMLESRVPARAA